MLHTGKVLKTAILLKAWEIAHLEWGSYLDTTTFAQNNHENQIKCKTKISQNPM